MQRFLDRPKGFFAVCGFNQDQTGRIKSERVQAVAMKTAMWTAAIGRGDVDQQARFR